MTKKKTSFSIYKVYDYDTLKPYFYYEEMIIGPHGRIFSISNETKQFATLKSIEKYLHGLIKARRYNAKDQHSRRIKTLHFKEK